MSSHFISAGGTDTGKVRRHNEDAILVREDLGLWVVADGLGGHTAGDYASAMLIERLGGLTRDGSVYDFIESIEDSLQQVNQDLRAEALARHVDAIATTAVVLVHDQDFVLCGWVGDSRAYCFEEGQLRQLTRDHVHGARSGSAEVPAGGAPLTRAVGAEERLFLDWVVAGSRPGMQFVLCSDGINKELSDDELSQACQRYTEPQAWLSHVFRVALGRSARDNLSAVMVRLKGP